MSLVVTGGPGVGKHTVAGRLARMHGLDVVDINAVAAESGMLPGGGGGDGGEGGSVHGGGNTRDVDTEALQAAVAGRLAGRSAAAVVVVGHLAPYVLQKDAVGLAIVLRRSPYELGGVYKARGYSDAKAVENQGAEILGVVAFDAAKRFGADRIVQVDVTGKTAEETAAAAGRAAGGLLAGAADCGTREAGRLRGGFKGDGVDWLLLVKSRGDLGRFFPTS